VSGLRVSLDLRALGRDIYRNLEEPLAACNAALAPDRQIRMEVRTGDTETTDRARQQRHRPHLLLTTPESLSSVLSQSGWRDSGFQPRTVIVDEIHAFAETKRGSLLALALERLEGRAKQPMQRIGLSATAWPVEAVTKLLCGKRTCAVASVDLRRAYRRLSARCRRRDTVRSASRQWWRIWWRQLSAASCLRPHDRRPSGWHSR
jgi:ATP-dependent helicase Lhr and Lhr-like helicase